MPVLARSPCHLNGRQYVHGFGSEVMADIKVERKGPSIWPWIIGLLVLALLIFALMELFGRSESGVPASAEPATGAAITPHPILYSA